MRTRSSRSRLDRRSLAASRRSSVSVQAPSLGRGCTARSYENAVSPERSTRRTVLRARSNSRVICLIDLPSTKCARLIRAIVSTTSISPTTQRNGWHLHRSRGVSFGRRLPRVGGQSSTLFHRRHPPAWWTGSDATLCSHPARFVDRASAIDIPLYSFIASKSETL